LFEDLKQLNNYLYALFTKELMED
jgi:hypothetical protein